MVAHLVVEHLLSIPRSDRTRTVHIAANDTLVESPLAIGHIGEGLAGISGASIAFGLPIVVATTTPGTGQTFRVNSPMGCETACTRPLTRADGRPWSVIPGKAGMTDFLGARSRLDRGNDGSSDLCSNRVYGSITVQGVRKSSMSLDHPVSNSAAPISDRVLGVGVKASREVGSGSARMKASTAIFASSS